MAERSELVYNSKINIRDAIKSLTLAREKIEELDLGFTLEKIDYIIDRLETILKSIK